MFNNTDIRKGYYGKIHYDTDGKEKYFEKKGKAVTLEEVRNNLEKGNVTWRLSFEYFGTTKYFEFERENIADKKMVSYLQGQGADVTARTFNCFIDSLRLQEHMMLSMKNTFTGLGWYEFEEKGNRQFGYRCTKLIGGPVAEYTGDLALTPKGSLDEWYSMVTSEVLGRPQLETILLAALSAPVVGLYGLNATTDNPLYHINYQSGMGKSTALYLAASVSGEPFDGKRMGYDRHGDAKTYSSVYGSWGATHKATLSTHAGNRGVVVILNELGKFVGTDMTTIVFNLSEGSDIKRLNTRLETLVSEGFNTVFISCGEMSLIGRCKSKLEGLKNRVMEIAVPMTENAEHSRRIKEGCCKNNGFAAPMIAKHILDNGGYEFVERCYREALQELSASAPPEISGRFIEKFPAFLVVTANLAHEALGISFDIGSVVDFCYSCAKTAAAEDGNVDSSYEDVIGECGTNVRFFFNKCNNPEPMQVWGSVAYPNRAEGDKVVTVEYGIRKNVLKDILIKHGHANINTCIDAWKKAGVLNHEKDRNTRSRTINADGLTEDVYVLKVLQDAPVGVSKPRKGSKLVKLLDTNDDEKDVTAKEVTAYE